MSAKESARIDAFISRARYPRDPAYLVAWLEDAQAEFGYVPRRVRRLIAEYVGVDVGRVERLLAQCPDAFLRRPRSPRAIAVCQGPVCRRHGAGGLIRSLARRGIKAGAHACLGACDRAPAARCGDRLIAPASAELIEGSR